MATLAFPPLLPQDFKWERSKKDHTLLQRRANGAETLVGIKESNDNGHCDMCLLLTLVVPENPSKILTLATLKNELAAGLLDIRFERPEIAATAEWDDRAAPPLIQYKPPKDNDEALTWALDTIHIHKTTQTGYDVFADLEKNSANTPTRSLDIYLVADVASENAPLKTGCTVDVLFYMNHLQWDGMGARFFGGDLLRNCNKNFGRDPSLLRYEWGQEIKRLGISVLCDLPISLDTSSSDFISSREDYVNNMTNMNQSWGLNPMTKMGRHKMMFHHFSIPESAAMVRGVKSRLGLQYTISFLGHAALLLTLLKINPLPADASDSTYFLNPLPINGRRWLRNARGRDCYTVCQTGAVMKFENIKSYIVDESDEEAVIRSLKKGAEVAKAEYESWLNNPYQLAAGISAHNFMAAASTTSGSSSVFSGVAGPLFISDGVNDRYIPGDIEDQCGEKLMSVENVICWANCYQPMINVRLDSWKGASKVSVYYNDGYYTEEEVKKFLDVFVSYLMVFVHSTPAATSST